VSKEQPDQHRVSQDQVGQDQVGQHYFTASPAAAHRPGLVQVVLPDLHFELATDAGVFSAGRLDPGTRVLLETVPPPPARGDLLATVHVVVPTKLTRKERELLEEYAQLSGDRIDDRTFFDRVKDAFSP